VEYGSRKTCSVGGGESAPDITMLPMCGFLNSGPPYGHIRASSINRSSTSLMHAFLSGLRCTASSRLALGLLDKGALRALGPPEIGKTQMPKTWDQFLQAALAVKKTSGVPGIAIPGAPALD